jgi:ATP-dependent protease Clp ATPase subunit
MSLLEKLGSDCSHEDLLNEVMPLVKLMFRPEFLNRLDEVVCFGQLSKDELKEVLKLQLKALEKKLSGQNITLDADDAARGVLLEAGYDPQFGARPMKRAVRRLIEDPMSEKIIDGSVKRGAKVNVGADGKVLVLSAENPTEVKISLAKPVSLAKGSAQESGGEGKGDEAVSLKKEGDSSLSLRKDGPSADTASAGAPVKK